MGAGKSLVAKDLGRLLKREVISTDELIEKQEQKTVAEIFSGSGQEHFRRLERKAVEEITGRGNVIIDCGGGIVLNKANIDDLKRNGILIYLAASPRQIYDRVKSTGQRPLLEQDNPLAVIEKLLAERLPLYEQADIHLDTDGKTVRECAKEILSVLKLES